MVTLEAMWSRFCWPVAIEFEQAFDCLGGESFTPAKTPFTSRWLLEVVATDVLDLDAVNALLDGCTDLIHTAATVMIRSSDPQKKITRAQV